MTHGVELYFVAVSLRCVQLPHPQALAARGAPPPALLSVQQAYPAVRAEPRAVPAPPSPSQYGPARLSGPLTAQQFVAARLSRPRSLLSVVRVPPHPLACVPPTRFHLRRMCRKSIPGSVAVLLM